MPSRLMNERESELVKVGPLSVTIALGKPSGEKKMSKIVSKAFILSKALTSTHFEGVPVAIKL